MNLITQDTIQSYTQFTFIFVKKASSAHDLEVIVFPFKMKDEGHAIHEY